MRRVFFVQALAVIFSLQLLSPKSWGASVAELVSQGDHFDIKFQPTEALGYYLPAEKMEPNNVQLLLRIARQYRHLMQDAEDLSEKLKHGGTARGFAERAVKLAPEDPEAHLSVAISHAKMVPILGTKERLEGSRHIKDSVDKAIELDPKKDRAWHILGCWHQRLAEIGSIKRALAAVVYGGVPEASNEDSVRCLKKAIELNPDSLIHYIELGRTYAQMGQRDDARKFIEKGLAMPDVGKDDPEIKRMGRETLKNLQ